MKQLPQKKETFQLISPKDLLRLPGKKALELILESPTPVTLVQSLAEEDLFWLVHDIGLEDALPILSLASNDQWQYLVDLEVWKKDRLEVDSVNQWIGLLLKADHERFLNWGLREHIELVELHLAKNIEVRIREEDESPSDFDKNYFTLDEVFYIRIKDEKYDQIIRDFLEHFAHHDLEKFHEVLLGLVGVLPAEIEENLYRLRNVRLVEKGFLPFEEAIGIYQHLNPQSLLEKEQQPGKVIKEGQPAQPVPASTLLLIKDQDPFYLSLKRIEDNHILDQLQIEFAAMCNQIISADSLVVRDKEILADVVRKACGYLSIGLEKVTGGDQERAARLLERFHLHQVFRVGYGAALELKWKTERWLKDSWFAGQALGLGFWEEAWEGILEGLLKKRPVFYTGLSKGGPYREFGSLEEITYCHTALDQVMAVDHLLSMLFAQTVLAHPVHAYHPVTYKNLFLTCWARYRLGLTEEAEPIEIEELKAFFRNLWVKETRPYQIDTRMKQDFLGWLQMRCEQAVTEIPGRAGKVLDHIFDELEKEYGSVHLEDLDPRYIKHFLVAP